MQVTAIMKETRTLDPATKSARTESMRVFLNFSLYFLFIFTHHIMVFGENGVSASQVDGQMKSYLG